MEFIFRLLSTLLDGAHLCIVPFVRLDRKKDLRNNISQHYKVLPRQATKYEQIEDTVSK